MQRLLYQAKWDVDAVCADVGDYVAEHLGEPDAVLVVDESGIPKKGSKSAGVAPQYCGARNTVVNCQVGVFVAYVSTRGTALVDRELYLPKGWSEDRERCQEAGIPEQVGFACKQQLAAKMLARLVGRVPAGWGAADAVYGPDTWLRAWLEGRRLGYVLGIRAVDRVEVVADQGDVVQVAAGELIGQLEAAGFLRLSAGAGVQGRAGGTGRGWSWRPRPCMVIAAGCWSAAIRPTPPSWPSSCAPARPAPRWRSWSGSRAPVGAWRRRSRPPRGTPGWTTTRSAAMTPVPACDLEPAGRGIPDRPARRRRGEGRGGDHAGCAGGTERAGTTSAAGPTGLAATVRSDQGLGLVAVASSASSPRSTCASAASPATRSPHLIKEVRP